MADSEKSWRRRLGGPATLAVLCAALALGLLVHMFAIAPYRIELSAHTLQLPVTRKLRVLHLSDLHSVGLGRRERTVLELARASAPDLIVVTGDSVTSGAPCVAAAEILDLLHAPLGVWVVPGNWEYWMAERQDGTCLCPSRKVHCLRNESVRLRDDLWLAGLDDLMAGEIGPEKAVEGVPQQAALIVLAHEPTALDSVRRPALILAGHTHGGQVCLPWFGPLALPPESGDDVSGWYRRGATQMYVSRGVGTSVVPARLWCGPEVAVLDIVPGAPAR